MRTRTGRFILVFGVVVGMVLGGGVAFANHRFSDVLNTNAFHKEIDFIADRSITKGCGDGSTYCPKDFVTREEMAAFMERVVRVATPVVLAKTETIATGGPAFLCMTDPYVPAYPQKVVLSGGAFATANSDTAADSLSGFVVVRVNGGPWNAVDNTSKMWDGNSPDSGSDMAIPLGGTLWLSPGSTYEFAARLFSTAGFGRCQLTAVISNRMPSTIILPFTKP